MRGDQCVCVIPIMGPDVKDTKLAIKRAESLSRLVGQNLVQIMAGRLTEEEAQLIREGKKLHAIRVHRERTGMSLNESKYIMDEAVIRLSEEKSMTDTFGEDWDKWEDEE